MEDDRTPSGQHLSPLAEPQVELGALVREQAGLGGLDHGKQLVGVAEPRLKWDEARRFADIFEEICGYIY